MVLEYLVYSYGSYIFKHDLCSFLNVSNTYEVSTRASLKVCINRITQSSFFAFRQQSRLLGNRKRLECSGGSSCVSWRHQDLYCVSVGPPTAVLLTLTDGSSGLTIPPGPADVVSARPFTISCTCWRLEEGWVAGVTGPSSGLQVRLQKQGWKEVVLEQRCGSLLIN